MKTHSTLRFPPLLASAFAILLAVASPADASMVPAGDLLPEIAEALADRGMPDDARIVLADAAQPAPVDQSGHATLESVSYNRRTGRFLIRVAGTADAPATVIAGIARAPTPIPTLIGSVERGAPITSENIAMTDTTEAPPADAILDPAELEGTHARRALAAGVVLRRSDVAAPILLRKGAAVSVVYLAPGLQLTQIGVALSSGARGDVIEVAVNGGARTLRAAISGPGEARVVGSRLASAEGVR